MLNIGEFARLAGVTVRMLHHYDALGLLQPEHVDPATGYRWYAAAQLPRLNRLVALKDLGLTLAQVGPVLDAQVGPEELRGMLTLRRAQIEVQMESDRARLAAIEARLRTIEKEGTMSELEFVEKALPPLRLAQITGRVADVSELGGQVGPAFDRLTRGLTAAGVPTGLPSFAWYSGDAEGTTWGVGYTTSREAVEVEGAEVSELPGCDRALTVIHRGSMATIGDTWQALATAADSRGLTTYGRCREVYIEAPMDDQDRWVTELQQPVR
ncbi:MerR family transcriptional regulator [Intrasporangium sp. YIM S08009]|uniref:MerR family transcriptional regulator n=1 Tax=Intrasporangium zincisolvens TaxID=3080018 RepID=UPI002B060BE2|nr:MerR family transcriptional regulator [Intrasporangium sp. YIM S08009]